MTNRSVLKLCICLLGLLLVAADAEGPKPLELAATGYPPKAVSGAVCSLTSDRQRVLWLGGRLPGFTGGYSNAINVLTWDKEQQATANLTWQQPHLNQLDPFAGRSDAAAAVAPDGRLFVFGGRTGRWSHSNELFVLDERTIEIRRVKPTTPEGANGVVPAEREGHSASFWGTKLVVFGGKTSDSKCMADLAIYDTVTGQWEVSQLDARAAGAFPRYGHKTVVHGDKLFVFGGKCGSAFAPGLTVIDLVTLTVESVEQQPHLQRAQHTATLVEEEVVGSSSSSVYIVGGYDPKQSPATDVLLFDLDKRKCLAVVTGVQIPRYGHCTVHQPHPRNRLVVIGGDSTDAKHKQAGAGSLTVLDLDALLASDNGFQCLADNPEPAQLPPSITLKEKVAKLTTAYESLTEFCSGQLSTIPTGELPCVTPEEVEAAQAVLKLSEVLPGLAARLEELRREAKQLEESYLKEQTGYHVEQSQINTAYEEVTESLAKYTTAKQRRENLEAELERVRYALEEARQKLGQLGKERAAAEGDLASANRELSGAEEEVGQLEALVAELRVKDEEYKTLSKKEREALAEQEELTKQLAEEKAARETRVEVSMAIKVLLRAEENMEPTKDCETCTEEQKKKAIEKHERELQDVIVCIEKSTELIAKLQRDLNSIQVPGTTRDVTKELNEAIEDLGKANQRLQQARPDQAAAQERFDPLDAQHRAQQQVVTRIEAELSELKAEQQGYGQQGDVEADLKKRVDALHVRIMALSCKWNSAAALRRAFEDKVTEIKRVEAELEPYRGKSQPQSQCQSALEENKARVQVLEAQLEESRNRQAQLESELAGSQAREADTAGKLLAEQALNKNTKDSSSNNNCAPRGPTAVIE